MQPLLVQASSELVRLLLVLRSTASLELVRGVRATNRG